MENKCGECTLCCTLLNVPELNKSALEDCEYCIVGEGCGIWKDRPDLCRGYDCAWKQSDGAPLQLRPDNCHMIFERVSGRLFLGTQNNKKNITIGAMKQIANFNKQGFSVLVNEHTNKFKLFLNESHHEIEIVEEFKEHVKIRGYIRN